MFLAGRLSIPAGTRALLFDLDGVLLDSLSLDYEIVARLLHDELGQPTDVPNAVIEDNFALAIPDFWQQVSNTLHLDLSANVIESLTEAHESARRGRAFPLHKGILELLDAAKERGVAVGVVSNNPRAQIVEVLSSCRIEADAVVGNDLEGLRRKPAPDTYLAAAKALGCEPSMCVAIEDSLVGAEAASAAGCLTVGVSTGGTPFNQLAASKHISVCYESFGACYVALGRGGVTNKRLLTPNDFVSHMVEHIAWRLGCSIDLSWTNNDWRELGRALGSQIRQFPLLCTSASTIGMIDDGSAEIYVEDASPGSVSLSSSTQSTCSGF